MSSKKVRAARKTVIKKEDDESSAAPASPSGRKYTEEQIIQARAQPYVKLWKLKGLGVHEIAKKLDINTSSCTRFYKIVHASPSRQLSSIAFPYLIFNPTHSQDPRSANAGQKKIKDEAQHAEWERRAQELLDQERAAAPTTAGSPELEVPPEASGSGSGSAPPSARSESKKRALPTDADDAEQWEDIHTESRTMANGTVKKLRFASDVTTDESSSTPTRASKSNDSKRSRSPKKPAPFVQIPISSSKTKARSAMGSNGSPVPVASGSGTTSRRVILPPPRRDGSAVGLEANGVPGVRLYTPSLIGRWKFVMKILTTPFFLLPVLRRTSQPPPHRLHNLLLFFRTFPTLYPPLPTSLTHSLNPTQSSALPIPAIDRPVPGSAPLAETPPPLFDLDQDLTDQIRLTLPPASVSEDSSASTSPPLLNGNGTPAVPEVHPVPTDQATTSPAPRVLLRHSPLEPINLLPQLLTQLIKETQGISNSSTAESRDVLSQSLLRESLADLGLLGTDVAEELLADLKKWIAETSRVRLQAEVEETWRGVDEMVGDILMV
ncbi:hypothetical protein P7C70_g2977, partial [Phenoliferia sp. Uapishka_3]